MTRTIHALLLAAAALACTPALAQQQTPANAQTFLQLTAEKTGATLSWYSRGAWNIHRFEGTNYPTPPDKVNSITSKSACMSVINIDDKYGIESVDPVVYKRRVTDVEVDWNKVPSVTQNGMGVELKIAGQPMRLDMPSESLAARVAYAMEFLRVHCDSSAKTGF